MKTTDEKSGIRNSFSNKKLDRFEHIKGNLNTILLWPAICLLLTIGIWIVALDKIKENKEDAEKDATRLAVSLSKAYSEQLTHAIQQIEYVTLNIEYQWEKQGERLDLADELKKGLFPPPSQLSLTVINRDGMSITSSLGGAKTSVADQAYFSFHRMTLDSRLRVESTLSIDKRSGRKIIHFTRRLEKSDGTFNGVIAVAVEPSFLASYNDEGNLNPHDFISIRHDNGELLVSEKGRAIRGSEVHIESPVFSADSGVMRMSADKYRDHHARIVAWQRLKGYPLVSYVGLSEADGFAEHQGETIDYLQLAAVISGLLLFMALIGVHFSIRMAWKKKQINEVKETYQLAVDQARDCFYMVRAIYSEKGALVDFLIEDCNNRGAKMTNQTKDQLIGRKISDLSHLKNLKDTFPKCCAAMATGFYEDEFQVTNLNSGKAIWFRRRLIRSGSGLAVTLRDISETKKTQQLLISSANTDFLTGLPNRYWLINSLPDALRDASERNMIFAVLFIDLDNFKVINDKYGHAIGDKLLRMAAERLKGLIRNEDEVARLGGDEFTVLLRAVKDNDEIVQVAKRIIQSFSEPFHIGSQGVFIGTSIGISLFPNDGIDADVLIQKADIAMYASKSEGKGTYHFFNDELYQRIRSRLDSEEELAQAIVVDQFEMHYQPRVNASSGEISGLEALARWNHPVRGRVSPVEFIAIAESTGSIVQLGKLILDKVFEQIAKWRADGEPVVPVSINISPRQLDAGELDSYIGSLLSRYGIPAELIEFELTESTMMSEVETVISQLSSIRRLGIKLHLDDFGTGYSSLSRLQEIDMQVIKIDRVFISKLGTSSQADVLVKTIVLMAKGFNMDVVAEGVETKEQLDFLRNIACDEVQGYLLSRPVSSDAVTVLLRQRRLITAEG